MTTTQFSMRLIIGLIVLALAIVATAIWWRFDADLKSASARVARGGTVVATPCGLIEYQQAGQGAPLLSVHGSGGGFDQGMAFAEALSKGGIRVIAMSRFGYLRTPMPADASAAAQADAHVCLLDALGIPKAAVLGGSAGGPSALQMALRHPDRVSALIMLVPLAYKPPTQADSVPPMTPWLEALMMQLIGSDFLFWAAIKLAPDQVIKLVLATPPELVAAASPQEKARIRAMLENILPFSQRAQGLRSDSAVGKQLQPSPLAQVSAPTLIISAKDDGYGTFASAQYTASQIPGAIFIGFESGGHTWVGHDEEVRAEIAKIVKAPSH